MPDSLLYTFNGIDIDTGQYLAPSFTEAELSRIAQGQPFDKDQLAELQKRNDDVQTGGKHYGVKSGVDPKKLDQSGWGVIFAPGADSDAAREALKPLLDLRRSQAGDRYHEYSGADGFQPGMLSSLDFLTKHGMGPGPADPDHVPYYLLIVGDPQTIPYEFQYQLDVQYAVGRLFFEDEVDAAGVKHTAAEFYDNYARSVALAESPSFAAPKSLKLFGPSADPSTQLSAAQLLTPLEQGFTKDSAGWDFHRYAPTESTKAQLGNLLGGADTPGLLLTASHGIGCKLNDSRQANFNGALVCSEWQGPGTPMLPDCFFTGDDLGPDARLLGLIAMHFACFGAGTPGTTDYPDRITGAYAQIAPQPFLARLPKRLLSHPKGGALAVASHIDSAKACSFKWDGVANPQTEVFNSTLRQLMDGYPIGAAFEYFNNRYAEMSTLLSQAITNKRNLKKVSDQDIVSYWIASNDARNFIVVGDPAVRLKTSADTTQQERMTMATITTPTVPATANAPAAPASATDTEFFLGFGSTTPSAAGASPAVSSQLSDALRAISGKIMEAYNNITTVQVLTYTAGDAAKVKLDDGSFDGANLRAASLISLDGRAKSVIPVDADNKPDETLWKLHSDMVDRALTQRVEILKLASDMATKLMGVVKL